MLKLDKDEKKQHRALINHYAKNMPEIKINEDIYTSNYFPDILSALKERYQKAPALFEHEGLEYTLPLAYEDFENMALTPACREKALHTYYRHKTHTAIRFLSKPNRWIHPKAQYINRNDKEGAEFRGWSDFKDYKFELTLCWHAASHLEMNGKLGVSTEARIINYIEALYELGRAHNMDTRVTCTRKDGTTYEEYQDDKQADKPTCYQGGTKRLASSVYEHPASARVIFNYDIITQIIKEEVFKYYSDLFEKSPTEALKLDQYFNRLCGLCDSDSDSGADKMPPPESINVPDLKERTIETIHKDYSEEIRQSFPYENSIVSRLKEVGISDGHFIFFYSSLTVLLQDTLKRAEDLQKHKTATAFHNHEKSTAQPQAHPAVDAEPCSVAENI